MDTQPILAPLQAVWYQLQIFIPKLLAALLVLAAGWLAASVLRRVLVRAFRGAGVDQLAEKAQITQGLERGFTRSTVAELLGHLGYWVILIATGLLALQWLGVAAAAEWLERFGAFLPRIAVGMAVFLFGTLLASFLETTVRAAALNAGWAHGRGLGRAAYTLVLLLASIMALEQLGVVTWTIQAVLCILLATIGLAVALAVGLGAQGLVRQWLEEAVWDKWKPPRP